MAFAPDAPSFSLHALPDLLDSGVVIVDAYNVLQTTGVLPPDLAGIEVDDLARLIGASRYTQDRVVLVCDGTGGGRARYGQSGQPFTGGRGAERPRPLRPTHGVQVIYAGPGHEADAAMETIIAREGRSGGRGGGKTRRMLVVSSDRRLRTAARRVRARWMSSEGFLAQLAADWTGGHRRGRVPAARPAVPLDAYSVAEWMAEFGYGGYARGVEAEPTPDDAAVLERAVAAPPPQRETPERDGSPRNRAHSAPRDTVIEEAMRAWPGRIGEDDLDMRKWLARQPE